MINSADLIIRQAQRLTDTEDGGGAMVATEVADGNVNELFPPLSRADRVHGEVSMRKVFLHCASANTDTLYGANIMLSAGSEDANTAVFMFAGEPFDTRDEAVEKLMQAAVKGELIRTSSGSEAVTWDDQFSGQARIFLRSDIEVEPGENLYIELDWPESVYISELTRAGEYVQVDSVEKMAGFQMITLRDGLSRDYPYSWYDTDSRIVYPTKLRRCHDNSGVMKYRGIAELSASAASGAKELALVAHEVQVLPVSENATTVAESAYAVPLISAVTALERVKFKADGFVLHSDYSQSVQFPLPVTADRNIKAFIQFVGGGRFSRELTSSVAVNGSMFSDYGTSYPPFVASYAVDGGRNKSLTSADLSVSGGFISSVAVPSGGLLPCSFVLGVPGTNDIVTDDGTGRLVLMDSTGAFTAILGAINYQTGVITTGDVRLAEDRVSSLLYAYGDDLSAPLQTNFAILGAYSLPFAITATRISDGATLTANVTSGGIVTGDAVGNVYSYYNSQIAVSLSFSDPVFASSIGTGDVEVTELVAIDPDAVGLSALRMPSSGRLPIVRSGDWLTLSDTQQTDIGTPAAAQVIALPRTDLSLIQLYDSAGVRVSHTLYSVDQAAGAVTMADPLDLSAYTMPLIAVHAIEENTLAYDISADGVVTLAYGLQRAWPAGSSVSSVLEFGDLQARVTGLFDQKTWSGVWSDDVIGDAVSSASYNDINYPVVVSNLGAFTERWALVFISTTQVQVIGEHLGNLGTFLIANPIQPNNPASGAPYFVVPSGGWGDGWAAGNVLRFNTIGAVPAVWLVRAVQPGPGTADDDSIVLLPRGDAA